MCDRELCLMLHAGRSRMWERVVVMPLFAETSFLAFDIGVYAQTIAELEFGILGLNGLIAFESIGIFLLCIVDVGFFEKYAGHNLRILFRHTYCLVIAVERIAVFIDIDIAVALESLCVCGKNRIVRGEFFEAVECFFVLSLVVESLAG